MKTSLSDRTAQFVADHRWAWLLVRYLVVPVVAAVHLVRVHIPEYIAETRSEVAELDQLLKAHRASL